MSAGFSFILMFRAALTKSQFVYDKFDVAVTYITEKPMHAKQKYRGMFETLKSGNKTSSGEIVLNIRTRASPIVGQDQVLGGVSVLCQHAAPVANILWKTRTIR